MKIAKKIVTIFLVLIMLALSLSPINAHAMWQPKIKRDCPNIEIHGFMVGNILEDKNDPKSDTIWPPNAKSILSEVANLLPKASKLVSNFNWDDFANIVADAAVNVMGAAFADENGEITDGSGVYFEYPKAKKIKKNSEVLFKYDWRVDPIETAAKLNDFIDYVLKCSGSDKVTLQCHSFGGVVVLSYLSIYGTNKVKGVGFNATAIYGETYTGDLMRGKLRIDAVGLKNYLNYALDGETFEVFVNDILDIAMKAGVLDSASLLANKLIDKILDVAAKRVLVPMFGSWLPIWAMVPDEYLKEAMSYVFDNVYTNENRNELKNKIITYNTLVRNNKTNNILKFNKEINIYVFSRYGYPSLPIVPSYNNLGDGIIDTKYSSFGATTSEYCGVLSDELLAKTESEYISPDKMIDASTCLLPKQTWFIQNMKHSNTPDALDNLIDMLLSYDGQADVYTFKNYPRFLSWNNFLERLSVNTGRVEITKASVLVSFFKCIIDLLKLVFKK